MTASSRGGKSRRSARGLSRGAGLLAASLALVSSDAALAYIGDSFISIPGQTGNWRGKDHKGWIRAEANEWVGRLPRLNSGSTDPLAGDKLYFGGPNAPKPGNFGKLVLSLSKTSADLPILMDICARKAMLPELSYAESSDRARPLLELGDRPEEFPAYWEYKLKDVEVVECPVVDGADQQALVLSFKGIEWLSYDPAKPMANRIEVAPANLPKVQPTEPSARKGVKSYLITWIAPATDAGDEACPKVNEKPSEADIFRYKTPEEAAKLREQNGEKGISYGSQSERRGPAGLSVANFPGIIPDPGLIEPNTNTAFGIDLDGDDGSGKLPKGIRKHGNFTSPDGRTGIDNQLLRVWGCVTGYRGKRGYNNQTPNARRADGNITTLIEISDIDDENNDGRVFVSIIHSMDKPIKDNSGKTFIPNYTFRPSEDPNFALFNLRVPGRITNGVVTTDVIPQFEYNPGQGAVTELQQARIRLEPQPDGNLRGYIGGYQDLRKAALFSGYSEGLFNFQAPAIYYAIRRNADGLQDPVTGEFNGISMAFEIDAVPAFLTPTQATDRSSGKNKARKSR